VGVRPTGGRSLGRAALVAVLLLTVAAGCGSSSKSSSDAISTNTVYTGQLDIQLPPGWEVENGKAIRPGSAEAAAANASVAGASGASSDTVPLAQENPQTKFFASLSTFSSCLKGLGVKFVGAPDPSNPNSPANDPTYLKNLGTCAAKSNILQALKTESTYQDNLTPAQIEQQNKDYLKWRTCMIGRGWGIPQPVPDSKGRLFSFGTGSGSSSVPNFTPPPGQDIITSSDVQECAAQVAKEDPSATSTTTGG